MSDLFGNHIVGFPERRLIYAKIAELELYGKCLNVCILWFSGLLWVFLIMDSMVAFTIVPFYVLITFYFC